ncbi:SIR2 family NAD-dependent protein deacylase [Jejuia pallidilutea]|uniref:NAD-dependent protein deacylase n=1 Tax=Jejuia pallidilutea TaxID=504487 RepID=A0A090WV00_9FLAO|nr:NAD-dependent deacylase [Jejuia pallidilutea]GAL67431.1 NAD-dependent protein deacetylase of SIR2 family [Jejuia pallidilutea]GAL71227.1 NAD-dependent protein deacetylase of SIR2 family [Jejuia pallidilutea]GAL88784.1 NAD-dependent protein deacetylase of SIR2 family [Jejuia pallidilutea]
MQHIVVLTGAGMSAESGVKTFRDANGLWEGHDVMEVATPEGFAKNPELVLDFYNQRRQQLFEVEPNQAHKDLAKLEEHFKVTVVTQNIDDLHERAGSTNVIHLHGELLKVRSTFDANDILDWKTDLVLGDVCKKGYQLRPHVVWFGEDVPMITKAMEICETADILLIIGTSMQVYPAAGLIHYTPANTPTYFIDPKPNIESKANLTVIAETATVGMKQLIEKLII